MVFRHYGKYVRNRMRKDGVRFLKWFEEAEVVSALAPAPSSPRLDPRAGCWGTEWRFTAQIRHSRSV